MAREAPLTGVLSSDKNRFQSGIETGFCGTAAGVVFSIGSYSQGSFLRASRKVNGEVMGGCDYFLVRALILDLRLFERGQWDVQAENNDLSASVDRKSQI